MISLASFFCHASCICFVSGGGDGGSVMATGGAASSSGTFCVRSEQFFMSNLAAWPGHQQKPAQQPAAQPKPAGQGGGNEVPHCMFLWWFKTIFFVPNSCDFVCTWHWLHLHHTIFYNHDLAGTKESKSSSSSRSSRSSSSEGKGEGTESSDGGRPECQHNPKGQGPKPKEVARQHKRSLCQLHSISVMAKKWTWKYFLGAGCEGWEVGKNKINDRCHKMAMHALKRAIHALTRAIHALIRAMSFGLQALKRAVAPNPFFPHLPGEGC